MRSIKIIQIINLSEGVGRISDTPTLFAKFYRKKNKLLILDAATTWTYEWPMENWNENCSCFIDDALAWDEKNFFMSLRITKFFLFSLSFVIV